MAIYDSTSRFKLTKIVNYRGNNVPALMKRFDFLDDLPNDRLMTLTIDGRLAGRPDLISNMLYGTTAYKWILFLFNNVINPFDGWPKVNTTIRAPSNTAVWREL